MTVQKKKKFAQTAKVCCVAAHPILLSRRGLNPIKRIYDLDRPEGQLSLTASAFNRDSISAVLVAGPTAAQNSLFSSLAVTVTVANTH